MTYAVIGLGAVGQALAAAFARKGIDVAVAGRRPPEALAQQAAAIGPTVKPKTLEEALSADTILLAVPFWEHREVAANSAEVLSAGVQRMRLRHDQGVPEWGGPKRSAAS